MTRRLFFLLGSVILVAAVLVLGAGDTVASVAAPPWGNAKGTERSAEVAGDTVVGQQFVAPYPGLHRIDVGLDPTLVKSSHQLTLHLKEAHPLATEDSWAVDLSTDDIRDSESYAFEFPPIRDSDGKTYHFYLESADSSPGDAITVRYDPASLLEGSSALVDGQPVDGNLQFETFYTLTAGDKLDILLTRMTEGRPYLFGNKWFYIGLAVVYVLLLGTFLWRAAQAIREQENA